MTIILIMTLKLISIIVISISPYLFSLHGDFVFDDSEAIVKNKDVTASSGLNAFYNDFWGTNIKSNLSHKSYRPLTIITFRLNYLLNNKKLSATQFKITNLLCHAVCCGLVWKTYTCIWTRVKKKNKSKNILNIPYLSAVLFSVHPIHVEAVSGIVGRADLLATITFLLSFLIYDLAIRYKNIINIYLFTSIILAGVAMLYKENGVTVLGICGLYDLVLNSKIKTLERLKNFNDLFEDILKNRKCFCRIVIITFSAMILLAARWAIMGGTKPDFKPTDNPASFSDNFFTKIATYNYLYFLNILLLMWPQWLCYDWSMDCVPLIKNVLDFRIIFVLLMYLYIVLYIYTICGCRIKRSSKRIILLATSFMVIPFLPAANIIYPVGFVVAERILYIPSMGYCLLIGIGLQNLFFKIYHKKILIGIYFCLIAIFGMKSWQRAYNWQNEYQLFTSALSVCPLNAKVHYNVAKVADAKQLTEWALQEYKAAIRLYPEYYQAMNNLANLLKNEKQFSEAEFYLRKALYYKQDFPAAWMNLGIVLANTGCYAESENAYKTALRYRKHYPDCFYNMGNLYLEINRTQEAIENWYQAINLNSKHVSAWTNLLALLDNTGQIKNALQIIPRALEELSDTPSINFAIANIYGKIDRYKEAEKYFLQTISLSEDRSQAIHYANLGVLYHRWKKYSLAEKMYKMALKIDPKFSSASKNLRNLERLIIKNKN